MEEDTVPIEDVFSFKRSLDDSHFEYSDSFFGSADEAKSISVPALLNETVAPVVNPFSSFGKREITTPVLNPFRSISSPNAPVAQVIYSAKEDSVLSDTDELLRTHNSSPSNDAFSICPPDSPDSVLSRSLAESPLFSKERGTIEKHAEEHNNAAIETDTTFQEHYYAGTDTFKDLLVLEEFMPAADDLPKPLESGITAEEVHPADSVDPVAKNPFDEDVLASNSTDTDIDLEFAINNVSINLEKNFHRFSQLPHGSLQDDAVDTLDEEQGQVFSIEENGDEDPTLLGSPQMDSLACPSISSTGSASTSLPSKAKSSKTLSKNTPESLSAVKLNKLLTDMQVQYNVFHLTYPCLISFPRSRCG